MKKSILKRFSLVLALITSASVYGQDTLLVTWMGTPGNVESTIMGDTTTTGEQQHDVYVLQANKTYLQLTEITVTQNMEIVGQAPADGEYPATLQPFSNAAGESSFTGWPSGSIAVLAGDFTVKDIILNGAFLDGLNSLGAAINVRGTDQVIHVDNTVISDYVTFGVTGFGVNSDIYITNSVIKAFTNGPNGMFFGGAFWGGGSWFGTVDTLVVTGNTIHNVIGNPFVIYMGFEHCDINHNTLANVTIAPVFLLWQNGMTFRNNLLYNCHAYGQSTYDVSGWGVSQPGGMGQMTVMPDYTGPDSTQYARGNAWDINNRKIDYHNNVWFQDANVISMFENEGPFAWDVETMTIDTTTTPWDTTITTATVRDTFMTVADQSKWLDDSTQVTLDMNVGVTESNNIHDNPGLNLDPMYITTQIARTLDFRDNLLSDTPPFDTQWWQYEHDNSTVSVEWPLHIDMSYDETSASASHCEHGGPVGDPRWMTHQGELGVVDGVTTLPNEYVLNQNYPNPFNPTTEISFSMNKTADVSLTIYSILGQKVRVLENASLEAGIHSYNWDGRDQLGRSVATGVYLYTLANGTTSFTKKMALMK